jgi:hypothetical protein
MNEEQKEKIEIVNKNSVLLRFGKQKIITCEIELDK